MPTLTDIAIVIRRWDFSETSQTVSLLTHDHGIVRGLAKGAKREKGNFSGGLDLLTEGEIIAIIKPGRDLATLAAWHLQKTYRVLRESLAANRAGLYMADLTHRLLIDHDPHPPVFDALRDALRYMHEPAQVDLALLRFQWALLSEAGYRPELSRDALTGGPLVPDVSGAFRFSARAGGVVSHASIAADLGTIWLVRDETIHLLRTLANDSHARASPVPAIGRANRLLASYVTEILGAEPPALRWAFPDLPPPARR